MEQFGPEAQVYGYFDDSFLDPREPSNKLGSYVRETNASLDKNVFEINGLWRCSLHYKSDWRDVQATAEGPSKDESVNNCAEIILAQLKEATKSVAINRNDAIAKSNHEIAEQYQREGNARKMLKNDLKWSQHPSKTLKIFATYTNATVSADSSPENGLFNSSLRYKSILRDIRATAKAQSKSDAKDQCAKEILAKLKEIIPPNAIYNPSFYERKLAELETAAKAFLIHSRHRGSLTLKNYGNKTNATIDLNISKENGWFKCSLRYRNILRDVQATVEAKREKKALDKCAEQVLVQLKGAISASSIKGYGTYDEQGDEVSEQYQREASARSILNNDLVWYKNPITSLNKYVFKTKATFNDHVSREHGLLKCESRYISVLRDIRASAKSRSTTTNKEVCSRMILAQLKEATGNFTQYHDNAEKIQKQRDTEKGFLFLTESSPHSAAALKTYVEKTEAVLDAKILEENGFFKCSLRYKSILRDIEASAQALGEKEAVDICTVSILRKLNHRTNEHSYTT